MSGDFSELDRWLPVGLLAAVAVFVGWTMIAGGDAAAPTRLDRARVAESIPPALLAAETYTSDPTADSLRGLFDVVGGFEGLELGVALGAFDVVSFDPNNHDRLLASRRSSYGVAENQGENEIWQLTSDGEVSQVLWEPEIPHDFVHYNVDGTASMWMHGGGDGFAPRVALARTTGDVPLATSEPVYASRFTSAQGTVFALTGSGDYYANEDGYFDLVADDGTGPVVLADGSLYAWVDNPTPELLIAYPIDESEGIAVWDVATLQPVRNHPLAGRKYQRAAISGDGTVAIGVTFDGVLERIDMANGVRTGTFGDVDIDRVDQPITLNTDGTLAITVENSGLLTIWWVDPGIRISAVATDQVQPRWVSSVYAATSTSVVSPDTRRVALRTAARSDVPTSWVIVDTNPSSWISRACEMAGQILTEPEARLLGLPDGQRACAG